MLSPKQHLDEHDINSTIATVRRMLRRGTSLEVAVRSALIVQFGSGAQFSAFLDDLDPTRPYWPREPRGNA